MNYLGASPRGIKKANARGESGTDPRVGVLNQKENKINLWYGEILFYRERWSQAWTFQIR